MRRVDHRDLQRYAQQLVVSIGATEATASAVAESLVEAELSGHPSHGVIRIPLYERMIADGAIDPVAKPTVEDGGGATVSVEGNDAFGQVVGRAAVDALTERATEFGIAIAGVRNAAHLGRIGEWGERAAAADVLFSATVNTQGGALSVAPAGSTARRFATNPFVLCVPTFDTLEFPILLDVSTAQVAHGKVAQYESDGRPLPGGWAVSPNGDSIDDPEGVNAFHGTEERGALRPLGGETSGYKGTGLAVLMELFAGIAGQAPVVGQASPEWFSNAASFIAIDPLIFSSKEAVRAKVESVAEHIAETPGHPDVPLGAGAFGDEFLLPGEAEYRVRQEYSADGIPVPDEVATSLRQLAEKNGVEEIPTELGG